MPEFNRFRFNKDLAGRVFVAKRLDDAYEIPDTSHIKCTTVITETEPTYEKWCEHILNSRKEINIYLNETELSEAKKTEYKYIK